MTAKEMLEIIKLASPCVDLIVQIDEKRYTIDKIDLIMGMQEMLILSTKEINEIPPKSN